MQKSTILQVFRTKKNIANWHVVSIQWKRSSQIEPFPHVEVKITKKKTKPHIDKNLIQKKTVRIG